MTNAPASARSDRDERLKQSRAATKPATPLKLIVSIRRQRVSIWDGMQKIAEAPISSGMSGHETPTGVFSILEKNRVHFSNLYNNAPMPFMQRLTWSGVALHAGALPGYPASHGCIRLPYSFAKQLFEMTRIGARVIVARDDVEPLPFTHPRLPVPLPPAEKVADATPQSGFNQGTPASVDMLIGVGQAKAAPAGQPAYEPQRTRASVAAARAAELGRLTDAIAKAEIERDYAEAQAAATVVEARDAQARAAEARASLQPITAARDAARRGLNAAEAQLASFVTRNRNIVESGDGALSELEHQEDELENRIEAATFEIEDLEKDIAEKTQTIRSLADLATAADAQKLIAADEARRKAVAVKDAVAAKVAAERAIQRSNLPITVFISRRSGKLTVRQGFEPLFEAEVSISEPEAPLGTHVFTALQYTSGDRNLSWNVVSLTAAATEVVTKRARTARARGGKVIDTVDVTRPQLPRTPDVALSRITIPNDVLERIAEYLSPGSTLMISDLDMSNETGRGTDIVLLTR